MQRQNTSYIISIIILGVFFFIFGFVTQLNDILVPYLKIACQLNTMFKSLMVTFAFFISYFFMAIPSSWILKKTGFKNGMSAGLIVMALGALVFIPAAHTRLYGLFLAGLFIIGTGLTILQAAVNPYVTIIGSIQSAARRISIMGICNKVAGMLAPLILGTIILSDADNLQKDIQTLNAGQKLALLNELASRVIVPYAIMAAVLLFLAMMVRYSPLPEIEMESGLKEEDIYGKNKTSVFAFPNLVLGVVALALYVGVEVISLSTISNYGLSQNIPLSQAKYFASYTSVGMITGYLLGISFIPKYITQSKALALSAVLGALLGFAIIFTAGRLSVYLVAALGLANAIMWPAIWPLAIHGLGKFTKLGAALLIMAIVGGAVLPPFYGWMADNDFIGHTKAYWIVVPCYLFILFYSLKGYKFTNWKMKRH